MNLQKRIAPHCACSMYSVYIYMVDGREEGEPALFTGGWSGIWRVNSFFGLFRWGGASELARVGWMGAKCEKRFWIHWVCWSGRWLTRWMCARPLGVDRCNATIFRSLIFGRLLITHHNGTRDQLSATDILNSCRLKIRRFVRLICLILFVLLGKVSSDYKSNISGILKIRYFHKASKNMDFIL